jgi:hypothetical protein
VDAISFLQHYGVAHLDLKPEHFMRRPGSSIVVLVDFGCAQRKDVEYDRRAGGQHKQATTPPAPFPGRETAWERQATRPASDCHHRMTFLASGVHIGRGRQPMRVIGARDGRYGTVGYRPEREATTFQEVGSTDMWAMGVIALGPVVPMGRETSTCAALEDRIYHATNDRQFQTFLAFVAERQESGAAKSPLLLQVAQLAGGQPVSETEPLTLARVSCLRSLLELCFGCLHPDAQMRLTPGGAYVSRFVTEYIADNEELERRLLYEGLLVDGRVHPDGQIQNPCVIILIPMIGLCVFALIDTAKGAPVSGYGGILQAPIGHGCVPCAEAYSFHTLPLGAHVLNGTPCPECPLLDLQMACAVGSMYNSCRQDPSVRSTNGNVELPDRLGCRLQDPVSPDQKVKVVGMNARDFIEWGSMFCWNYDWAKVRGGWAWSQEEIEYRQRAHSGPLPALVQEIIGRRRQEVLAQYQDAERPPGEVCLLR